MILKEVAMKRTCFFLLLFMFGGAFFGLHSMAAQDTVGGEKVSSGQPGFEQQPERNFKAAAEEYLKKEYEVSAEDLEKASAFMEQRAKTGSERTKASLNKSAQELDRLADDMEKGAVRSVQSMKETFARADRELANYYHEKAAESYARNEFKKAGRELKESARSLQQGMGWAGYEVEQGSQAAISRISRMGEDLEKGTKVAAADVKDGISSLGDEIRKFGNSLKDSGKG
jgi:hypothetical protein